MNVADEAPSQRPEFEAAVLYSEVVRPLGSIVLAALLHGVPRAVDTRTFGAQRSVYIDVMPADPELLDFATALEGAIVESALTLTHHRSEAAVVVELLGVSRSAGGSGGAMEAARFALRSGARTRPVILHYRPGERHLAARHLLERLGRIPA